MLTAAAVGMVLTAAATTRLTMITCATPVVVWVEDYPTLLDPHVNISSNTQHFARVLSSFIADAALIRGLQSVCFDSLIVERSPQIVREGRDSAACLAEIGAALRMAPASGELWLFKAAILARDGQFGEQMMSALRNAYRTTPAEGWIASGRVVLGLKLFPTLASDLREGVRSDLRLVLKDREFARPLVNAYATDSTFRTVAAAPLHELATETMQSFVGMVRAATRR